MRMTSFFIRSLVIQNPSKIACRRPFLSCAYALLRGASTGNSNSLRTLGASASTSLCATANTNPLASPQSSTTRLFSNQSSSSTRTNSTNTTSNNSTNSKKGGGPKTYYKYGNLIRADRVLSNRGWGTRKESFAALKNNRVAIEREGKWITIRGPSEKIPMKCKLIVDGREVEKMPLLYVYHKPKWVLSVMSDSKDRPNLEDKLPLIYRKHLHPVGRLDYDTSGLLLFSSKGKLTQQLLHPSAGTEKEYVALVEGRADLTVLREQFSRGVETTAGVHTAEILHAEPLPGGKDAVASLLKGIKESLPSEYNVTDLEERGYVSNCEELTEVRLVVSEGKHRMVRRMLANCGHPVVQLKRERHGEINLGNLKEGEFRKLLPEELEWAEFMDATKKKIKS